MNKKRFKLPSKRQLTYNRFNVDEFEKRFREGGVDALKTLFWNYERGRFQWKNGENCVVAQRKLSRRGRRQAHGSIFRNNRRRAEKGNEQ